MRWTAILALLGGILLSGVSSQPAAAAPSTCGYGTNGPGANTLCWFDMSGYSEAAATSPSGQEMEVALRGGYVVTFTLHKTAIAGQVEPTLSARAEPLEPRFAFGTAGYAGIPAPLTPILYSNPVGGGTKGLEVTLSDIAVVDAAGNEVTGYRFVIADAENNVAGESFRWTSDADLQVVAVLNPAAAAGCSLPLPGVGTTSVTCTGQGAGNGPYNGVLVGADTPSEISLRMSTFAQSGVAFAIQTATLTVDKTVASRVDPDDSFDVSVVSPEGTAVSTGSTGTGDAATTGTTTVLPRVDGGAYTLREAASAGSSTVLSNYDQSWTCTNTTTGSTTPLPSGSGISKSVSPAPGDDIRCTVTNTAKATSLQLVKHAGPVADANQDGLVNEGDRITYTFDVTNTGALPLDGITVSDPLVGAVSCPADALQPESSMTCTADDEYVVTAADVVEGSVDNSATAGGFAPGSSALVTSAVSTTSTPTTAAAPAITLVKSASPSDPESYRAGEVITFTFVITNSGNVPLAGVTVAETDFSGSGSMSPIECPPTGGTLAPQAQLICTATYTLTQADVDSTELENTARATGTPPEGPVVTDDSTAMLPVTPAPALEIVKAVEVGAEPSAGDHLSYEFLVTNTGNVTVTEVSVEELAFDGAGSTPAVECPVSSLAPGQRQTCTAEYPLQQADIDNGSVTNTARATGSTPDGETPVSSAESTAVATIAAAPALTLVKSASPSAPAAFRVGETVTYSFVVTNTGNVTMHDVVVEETEFSGSEALDPPVCGPEAASLAPGDQVVCTTTYTITQADIDAGSITNAAIATAVPPRSGTPIESPGSSVTIPEAQEPALGLVKSADRERVSAAGQDVTYTFVLTNTGNTTLHDPGVQELDFSGNGELTAVDCPEAPTLVPGQSLTCEAAYSVVASDLSGEPLRNTAVATASTQQGDAVTSAPSRAEVATEKAAGALPVSGSEVARVGVVTAVVLLISGAALVLVLRRGPELAP